MKKTVLVSVFLIFLAVVLVAPVHASVSVENTVEDTFLNSPFLILAVFILVIIVALIYRRVR